MLVLTRKVGQRIMVPGCHMTISVVKVAGNSVRLGISAPPEITVHREGVYRKLEHEDGRILEDHGDEAALTKTAWQRESKSWSTLKT